MEVNTKIINGVELVYKRIGRTLYISSPIRGRLYSISKDGEFLGTDWYPDCKGCSILNEFGESDLTQFGLKVDPSWCDTKYVYDER